MSAVSIPSTQVHTLKSSNVDECYTLFVALPLDYEQEERYYPTLYVLDANFFFATATEIVRGLGPLRLPELIIVGIGYPVEPSVDTQPRHRDYYPAPVDRYPGSGGGPKFVRFLKDELFPYIESTFRATATQRALFGYSAGGVFALYALLRAPGLFSRYVIGSPPLGSDTPFMFSYEQEYAEHNNALDATVFMSVGSEEGERFVPPFHEFVNQLRSRNYHGLELTTSVLRGHTHHSAWAPSMAKGLLRVFGHTP